MTITTELAQRMREAAEQATKWRWWIDSHGSAMVSFTDDSEVQTVFVTHGDAMGPAIRHKNTGNLSHWRNDADATHISTSNPDNVLALLDALTAKDKQIAELAADGREMRQRIAELESQRQMAFMACNRWADKFRGAESRLEARPEQQPVAWTDQRNLDAADGPGTARMWGNRFCEGGEIALYTEAPAAQPVTVKLPAKMYVRDMRANVVRWSELVDVLTAAGIKIAEGE